MAHPQIAVFARLAEGQAALSRRIEGQTTLLSRTMHSIAYDDVLDRIIVPNQFGQAILSFDGDAAGEVPPVRVIHGPRTGIKRADKLTVDPLHGEIFLSDEGAVRVFPADAHGDVAPIRVISGPDTQLGTGGIPFVAVDPIHDVLIVSARGGLLIFDRMANGNAKPLRVLTGAGGRPTAYKGLLFARASGDGRIGVWSVDDDGPAEPRWTFGDGYQVRQIAIDAKNSSVIVSDRLGAVYTYYVPEVFAELGRDAQVEHRPSEERRSIAWENPMRRLLGRVSQAFSSLVNGSDIP